MQFMEDMRRFLKGDEGMLSAFEFRNRRNPAEYAVIDYMANTNGFTLMDTVSYDRKHRTGTEATTTIPGTAARKVRRERKKSWS